MKELSIDNLKNAFKKYSFTLNGVNRDDSCFYYERGTSGFPFNQSENGGFGYNGDTDQYPQFNSSIQDVVNGWTYADTIVKQSFRKKDTILASGQELTPNTQISCYLIAGASIGTYNSLTDGDTNRFSVFMSSDPSDTKMNEEQSILPNLVSHVTNYIFNNTTRFDESVWNVDMTINPTFKEPDSDIGKTIFEKMASDDSRVKEIVNLSNENDCSFKFITTVAVNKNVQEVPSEKRRTVKWIYLDIVFTYDTEYHQLLKIYFDPDNFIEDHIGSIDAVEIFAYTNDDSGKEDNLVAFGSEVYATIKRDEGGYYDIVASSMKDFIWAKTNGLQKYSRHKKMTDITLQRKTFDVVSKEYKVDKTDISQHFYLFHSMETEPKLNETIYKKITTYIFDYIQTKNFEEFKTNFINNSDDFFGTEKNSIIRNVIRHVYPTLNYLKFIVLRKLDNLIGDYTENFLDTVSPYRNDVDKQEYVKLFVPCQYSVPQNNLTKYMTSLFIGYLSKSVKSTPSSGSVFADYSPVEIDDISIVNGLTNQDFFIRVLTNSILKLMGLSAFENIGSLTDRTLVVDELNKVVHFKIDDEVYGISVGYSSDMFEYLKKLY